MKTLIAFLSLPLLALAGVLVLVGSIMFMSCTTEKEVAPAAHAGELEQAFNERVLPMAAFVRAFEAREHRLPTDDELEKAGWHIGSNGHGTDGGMTVYTKPSYQDEAWGVPGKDFVVDTDVPGWTVTYQSWDGKRTEFNWL